MQSCTDSFLEGWVQEQLGDLLHARESYAIPLLPSQRMPVRNDLKVWPPANHLSSHSHLKVERVGEQRKVCGEPAPVGWLILATMHLPEFLGVQEILGTNLRPDTQMKGSGRKRTGTTMRPRKKKVAPSMTH